MIGKLKTKYATLRQPRDYQKWEATRGTTHRRGDVTRTQGAESHRGSHNLVRLVGQEITQRYHLGQEGGGKKSSSFSFLMASNLLTMTSVDQTQVAVRPGWLGNAACRGCTLWDRAQQAKRTRMDANPPDPGPFVCLSTWRGSQVRCSRVKWLWSHQEIQHQPKHQLTPAHPKILGI